MPLKVVVIAKLSASSLLQDLEALALAAAAHHPAVTRLEASPLIRHVAWSKRTLPSLNVDLDPKGYLEDLGPILEVLGFVISTI